MSWWSDLQDRIADNTSGFFVSDEDVQTAQEVAAAQQKILDRQLEQGKVDQYRYADLSQQVQDAGSALGDYKEQHSDPTKIIPLKWKLLAGAAIVIGLFLYFGGGIWLRALLKRKFATAAIAASLLALYGQTAMAMHPGLLARRVDERCLEFSRVSGQGGTFERAGYKLFRDVHAAIVNPSIRVHETEDKEIAIHQRNVGCVNCFDERSVEVNVNVQRGVGVKGKIQITGQFLARSRRDLGVINPRKIALCEDVHGQQQNQREQDFFHCSTHRRCARKL